MPGKRVFISHSSEDKPFVDRLASDLERMNIGVWYDKWELRVGDSIIDKIQEGIESQDFLIIVLSPASVASNWVKRELNAALMRELGERRVVVLPVRLVDCTIPVFLQEKKYADFVENYEHGFEELLIALFPQNQAEVIRSKDFRTVQYLIAGLSATDRCGTNTLNAIQLSSLYRFRHALKSYLGPEEKRLIFWSILSFKRTNSWTPHVLCTTTPVWGLINETNDTFRGQWIIDGLGGPLFEYLIPFYEWASETLRTPQIGDLKRAFLVRQGLSDLLYEVSNLPPQANFQFCKALALEDPAFFQEYFHPTKLNEDHPSTPATVEALAYLKPAYDDQFFFSFLKLKPKIAFSAFKGLAYQNRPSAVTYLREALKEGENRFSSDMIDEAFGLLGNQVFISELRKWLESCSNIECRVRILAALANAGYLDRDATYDTLRMVGEEDSARSELLPLLIHVIGRFDIEREKGLHKYLDAKHPVVCEAAIFAFVRLYKSNAVEIIRGMLDARSETVVAATVEALAKAGGIATYKELLKFSSHRSPLVRSAFYRAIRIIRPPDWHTHIETAEKDRHPLVRLAAARAFSTMAPDELLHQWLGHNDLDAVFRICADERLFSRFPFIPAWLNEPELFDQKLVRYPVRLTNLDPDEIQIHLSLNLNRSIDVRWGKDIT